MGLQQDLWSPRIPIYTTNRLFRTFGLEEPEDAETPITDKEEEPRLAESWKVFLKDMLDYAAEKAFWKMTALYTGFI